MQHDADVKARKPGPQVSQKASKHRRLLRQDHAEFRQAADSHVIGRRGVDSVADKWSEQISCELCLSGILKAVATVCLAFKGVRTLVRSTTIILPITSCPPAKQTTVTVRLWAESGQWTPQPDQSSQATSSIS